MDKVKRFISDNKVLIIVGVLLLIICIGLYFYDYKKKSEEYNKAGEFDTPYVKREYKVNEYTNIDVELIDILNDYYASFIKKKYTNPKEAYEMLTSESKKKFETAEKYEEYAKKTKTINTYTNTIKEYRKDPENKYAYDIIDTEGNKYTFIEKAIWDIEVSDNGK